MSAEGDIQIGTNVMLRGGGPEMTVLTRSHNLVYCTWKEGEEMRQGAFRLDSVERAPRPAHRLLPGPPEPAEARVPPMASSADDGSAPTSASEPREAD